MLSIALLDDNAEHLAQLERGVTDVMRRRGTVCLVRAFATGDELLGSGVDFDLYLLDVKMPGMSGMEVARHIRARDARAVIMFITSSTAYAVEGYSVNAFDYIVKPIDARRLESKLVRAIEHVELRRRTFLTVESKSSVVVPTDAVAFVEMLNRKTVVHMASGETHACYRSLAQMQKELPERFFFRCHAAYIVNVAHVEGVEADTVSVCGEKIPLARARRKGFLDFLATYLGRVR